MHTGEGQRELSLTESFTYFQKIRPVARAGYSIYIYHIEPNEANGVRNALGLPPIDDADHATVENPDESYT